MPDETTHEQLDLQAIWEDLNRVLREGAVNRALWDAAEAAQPLTLEGDLLVLALSPENMRHASYLTTDINRSRLRQILHARTGRRLDLRVIPGTGPEDWERTKARERQVESETERLARTRAAYQGAQAVWEQATSDLADMMGSMRSRTYATARARLLSRSFPLIAQAEEKARELEPEAEATHEKYLNRLLDKVADWIEMPDSVVALEYLRYAASQKRT
ncbi:MAG: hypothetical protein GX100_06855 [candidate division WS1 bacterium]|jgi:hypothetical protein|nr:hypothetical protein [candidate division WS1 bacterium]